MAAEQALARVSVDEAGGHARAIAVLFICLAAQVLCGGTISNLVGVASDDIASSLGIDKVTVLLVTSSLFYLCLSASMLLVGLIAHRFERRALLVASSVAVAAGFAVLAVSEAVWQLAIAFGLLFAFGFANMQLATNALVVQWFDRKRGAALAVLAMGTSIAGVLLAPFYGVTAGQYGWRGTVGMLGLAALLPLVPAILFVRDREVAGGNTRARERPGVSVWAYLARGPLWSMVLSLGPASMSIMAVLGSLRLIAGEAGVTGSQVALLFSGLSGAAIGGKILFMVFSDRMTQRQIAIMPLLMVAIACGILSGAASYAMILTAVVFLGLSLGAGVPGQSLILALHFRGNDFVPAAGICMMMSTLGLVVGPPGLAAARAAFGSYPPVFAVAAVAIGVLMLPVALLLPRKGNTFQDQSPAGGS